MTRYGYTKFRAKNCQHCSHSDKEKLQTKEPCCNFPMEKGFPPCLKPETIPGEAIARIS